ncbi:MAG: YlmC/YmxH family sporulation protein [Oscillospiraceae bacterium]|nr:YlmC/YmxH family sporulation protein [Oscillospiraceae bacterium]
MQQRFSELRCKEVINICDGARLGYVDDLVLELPQGQVIALIVPGPSCFFGLFGRECDYYIPWPCIKRMGDDIILVDVIPEQIKQPKHKMKKKIL